MRRQHLFLPAASPALVTVSIAKSRFGAIHIVAYQALSENLSYIVPLELPPSLFRSASMHCIKLWFRIAKRRLVGAIRARNNAAQLDIPHEVQATNMCVPTCAAMVLNYYGKQISQFDVYEKLVRIHPSTLSRDWQLLALDSGGFRFTDVATISEQFGCAWFSCNYRSRRVLRACRDISQSVASNCPVIVSLDIGEIGHAVVVTALDLGEDIVSYVDPAVESPGIVQVRVSEFLGALCHVDGLVECAFYRCTPSRVLGYSPNTLIELVRCRVEFGKLFKRAAGNAESLAAESNRRSLDYMHAPGALMLCSA